MLGREIDGTLTRNGASLSISPGLYLGAVSPGSAAFGVTVSTTASAGAGTLQASGLTTASYFTEFEYNALGNKVATNETTGQWRRLGVDAMGNILRTSTFGARADETAGRSAIVTYSAFDARGLEVARFGAAVKVDNDGDGTEDANATRAVTRFGYDYERRKISQTDPGAGSAQSFVYNALGQMTSHTDALGHTTTIAYDRRGNEVRRTDARGNVTRQTFNAAGRKTADIDALGNTTSYTLDAFGRVASVTDARGNATIMQYDQHDRLVKSTDALSNITEYSYDKRDNRLWTKDANGNFFGAAYDNMRRVTARYAFSGGRPGSFSDAADAVANVANAAHAFLISESAEYDVYGNKISDTDAEGRKKIYTYGAFGRLATLTDEGQRLTSYTYDRFGRLTAEARADDDTTSGAKDISRSYDDAGRLKSVTDNTTRVSTSYTYTVAGLRAHETVQAPGLAANTATVSTVRNISYGWDGAGQMSSWSDSVSGTGLFYAWDAAGNLSRVRNSDNSVDHHYAYDAADRLTGKTQGSGASATTLEAYTYDAAGNRATFNNGSSTSTYTWNAANRVTAARTTQNGTQNDTSDDTSASWTYDKVGNISRYEEFDRSNASVYLQTTTLTENYRTSASAITNRRDAASISITGTVNTLDKSGRLLKEVTTDSSDAANVRTYTYAHAYSKDGRELSVTATGTGSLTGSSTSTYDANDKLARLDLGKPDGSNNTAAFKQFRYSNEGQILTGFYDNGVSGDQDVNAEYLYANGHIVGQKANTTTSATVTTLLDDRQYSLNEIIGATYPGVVISRYEVQPGDTLQSVAARQFGNPSLWYVIADANGLAGDDSLKPGTQLTIPNTSAMGRLTADAHVVYNESQIIGSKLPNLAAPPPPEPDKCAQAAAIVLTILVSIIAVVVTVLTAGALAPLAIAAAGVTATSAAGIIIGATVGAVVGATIGLASGAINQGIKIGLKVQSEFNWKEVAADVAAGAIGGVGAAFSGVAQASIKAAVTAGELSTRVGRLARVATVAMDAAFNVAGEASSQAINYNGRIEEPWMLGVAGGAAILGEAIKPLGSRAWRAIKPTAFGQALQSAGSSIKAGAGKVFRVSGANGKVAAATAGELTEAGDNALASTLRRADSSLAITPDGKADLSLRASNDAFDANNRTSAYTPNNVNDNAARTLAPVQAQSSFDQLADPNTVQATRKALAGEVNGLTGKSQTELAQGTVGRVRDNTIPVSQPGSDTPALGRLRQASTLGDDWNKALLARQNDLDVATPPNADANTPSLGTAPGNGDNAQATVPNTPAPDGATPRLAELPDNITDNVIAPPLSRMALDEVTPGGTRGNELADAFDAIPSAPPPTPRGGVADAPTSRVRLGSLPDRLDEPSLLYRGLDEADTGLRLRSNSAPGPETPSASSRTTTPDNPTPPDNAAPPRQPTAQTAANDAPTANAQTDNASTPARSRNRAFARNESNLPEAALDTRTTIQASSRRFLLSPNVLGDEKSAERALKDYFRDAVQTKLEKSNALRRQQFFGESEYLRKVRPDALNPRSVIEENVYRFQQSVATYEISSSKNARKAMADYLRLRELDIASGPAARTRQFLEMDEALSRVLGSTKLSQPSQQFIRNEMQLLRDTATDAHLLKSMFIRNPTHAMELKRLGMQPSAASRVGQFTDVRLDGAMKELGSGNLNTVYLGKYILPDNQGSFDGVFKMEARELRNGVDVVPMAGKFAGIDMSNPRFGYRNVATTRLDEMLGFDITTRTEMAIYRGKLGTVAERAPGVSAKGSQIRALRNKLSDAEVEIKHNVARQMDGYKHGEDWTRLLNDDSDEILQRVVRDGREEFYLAKRTANELNYSDPVLRRGLVRLHLEDAISGQVDRHYGNYFVLQDARGNVVSVKGIDNDLSWGKDLRQVEKIGAMGVHLPDYLPRVVDRQAFDSIMALNREKLMQRLGGVLQRNEIDAAVARLDAVKAHLKTVHAKGRVLNSLDDWRGDQIGDLLTRRKGVPPNSGNFQSHHTSYVSRDMALMEHKRQDGLLDPYPANRYAQ